MQSTPQSAAGWFNARNALIAVTLAGGTALYFEWSWLVSAGLASVILGLLPCVAMCALGICASRMGTTQKPDERE